MSVSLDNVVRVSVAGPARGLSNVSTSAMGIITHEAPITAGLGDYKVYLDPLGVAKDFGSGSDTYTLANYAFSQKANVIKGGGYVVVIPRKHDAPASAGTLISSKLVDLTTLTADKYGLRVWVDGNTALDIEFGKLDRSDIGTVLESLNSQDVQDAGFEFTATGDMTGALLKVKSKTLGGASVIGLSNNDAANPYADGINLAAALFLDGTGVGSEPGLESEKDTILRTYGKIPYFGVCYTQNMQPEPLTEVAATVQALNLFQVVASSELEYIGDTFKKIKEKGYTKTRCLFYSESEGSAALFAAGYLSILMSTNFNVSGSSLTMNLKDFVGLKADELIDDDLLHKAKLAGVDVIADIGVPKIISHGANQFADQVYSRMALKVDIQIAGVNLLGEGKKIPQTEDGMIGLKGAYRLVLSKYINSGVLAPGEWTSSSTFGADADDHRRNIRERGYYIYSAPLTQETKARRSLRIAPVVQIAVKEAGAIHNSDVIITVEE